MARTVFIAQTIRLDATATDDVGEDNLEGANQSSVLNDTDSLTASDDETLHYSDTLTATFTSVDPVTGVRTVTTDTSTVTSDGTEHDQEGETDIVASGVAENDTANSLGQGSSTTTWSGTETVVKTNANGSSAGATTTTTDSGFDNWQWSANASQDAAGHVTGGGSSSESESETLTTGQGTTTTSTTGGGSTPLTTTFAAQATAGNSSSTQTTGSGNGGWFSSLWGGATKAVKRADQFVGQVNTLAWTGTWVHPQTTSGVTLGAAVGKGLAVGGKAVANSAGHTVVSTVTLGAYEGPDLITVTDTDRAIGYNTSAALARVGTEILTGVATGGAATALSKGGKAAKAVSYGLRAMDVAQNGVNIGNGAVSAAENGFTLGNSLQIAGGVLGNVGALSRPGAITITPPGKPFRAAETVAEEAISSVRRAASSAETLTTVESASRRTYRIPNRIVRDEVDSYIQRATEDFLDAGGRFFRGGPPPTRIQGNLKLTTMAQTNVKEKGPSGITVGPCPNRRSGSRWRS